MQWLVNVQRELASSLTFEAGYMGSISRHLESYRGVSAAVPGPGTIASRSPYPNFGLLVLVGAGKMGGALLQGWLRLGLDPKHVAVLEPAPSADIAALESRGLRLNPDANALKSAAAIVIALKPQGAAQIVPSLAPLICASTVVVSIMAGRTLRFLAGAVQRWITYQENDITLKPSSLFCLTAAGRKQFAVEFEQYRRMNGAIEKVLQMA